MRSTESEVFPPWVMSRMKQVLDTPGQKIYPTQVGALTQIAAMACQCEILDVICAAVLTGNDMLNMVQEFAVVLMEPTILTPLSGPLSNEAPGSSVGHS